MRVFQFRHFFFFVLTFVAASRAAGDASVFTIADNRKPPAAITISQKASDGTRSVAAELAGYLGKMTGATFEVRAGDGSSGIVLGTIAEFPNRDLEKPLEIRDRFDGREAYAIRTEPGRVRLIGATDLGTSHAAFRFLELLGCRWFFPATEWEIIPKSLALRIDADETDRPAMLSRRIGYGYGLFGDEERHRGPSRAAADYASWCRHNRMASSVEVHAGHAWQAIILQNKAEFDRHPEYLALVKGKRKGPQLCVSNPAVRKLAIEFARDHFRKHPDADMVSMETSDGEGQCECDDCRKLGTISDRAFGLANEVAKVVATELPGRMVGMLAYAEHGEPPAFALEPNVYVQLAAGFVRGRYTFDELLELWPKRTKNFGIYEYFSVWPWDFDRLPGGRAANVPRLRQDIGRYAAAGVTTLNAESGNNWGLHGRGYYVANRLMWNPKADVDSLLSDFYDKAFGPAAAPMRRYYERVDPGNKPLISRSLVGEAFRDVDEASRLAADRPDVTARLDQVKQYLRYEHLAWQIDRERDMTKKKELTLVALTHCYRTRYAYMNHWRAMEQGWAPKAATEFNEPSWARGGTAAKPWAISTPYTHEETEKEFREGLAFFQPQEVTTRTFSADLAPVRFLDDRAAAAASSQTYQNGPAYALYSPGGKPIEIEITTGVIAHYRNRPDPRYTLRTPAGAAVAEGRLPLDGEKHKLSMPVPAAGLYHFEFSDSGTGWKIDAPPGQPCAILLREDLRGNHIAQMQPLFFYVPKGTKQIDYFWQGKAHKVLGPDGKVVRNVATSGEFVSIPVPPGADGRCWRFTGLSLGRLWFFNVPNQVAASPEALLIPRDLAKQDGLEISAPQ